GEVTLPNGDLDALQPAPGNCSCDVVLAKDVAPKPAGPAGIELRVAEQKAEPIPIATAATETKKPDTEVKPTVTAVMPPLSFEAKPSPPPPNPKPEAVTMMQEMRVTPTVVFTGQVNGAVENQETKGSAPVAPTAAPQTDSAQKKPESFGTKLKNFFR